MEKEYAFIFEKPVDWTKDEHPDIQANTLKEAYAINPAYKEFRLVEIWCMITCNLVWGFENDTMQTIPQDILE